MGKGQASQKSKGKKGGINRAVQLPPQHWRALFSTTRYHPSTLLDYYRKDRGSNGRNGESSPKKSFYEKESRASPSRIRKDAKY